MKPADLLIFGATRNTGLLIAQHARQKGYSVAAMVRSESDRTALEKLNVSCIEGDAFSLYDCQYAFRILQPKYVISTLGGKNKEGQRIDAAGNINIIQAALASARLDRFILMTSMGCGEQLAHLSEQAKKFLGEALQAKTEAENILKETQLPWSIVRPGGLNNEPPTGHYTLMTTGEIKNSAYISRSDVALAIMAVLENKQFHHKIISIGKVSPP